MRHDLMPPHSATGLEVSLSLALDRGPELSADISGLQWSQLSANLTVWPYLIFERGLSPVTQYVSNSAAVLQLGTAWQRVRGTPKAIELGLSWINYTAGLEEYHVHRRRWHLYQLHLDRVRDSESDLEKIEGIADLSDSSRNDFFRGYHGYDVRAMDLDNYRLDGAALDDDSGVQVDPNGAKWSFGRLYDNDQNATQAMMTATGVWIAPNAGPFTWAMITFPWYLANFAWGATVNSVRRALMAAWLETKPCWIEFKDATGAVIGYRRVRAKHLVVPDANGIYQVGTTKYGLTTSATEFLYVEALTDFGDGYGKTAKSAALRFGATPNNLARPGDLWLLPGQITLPHAAIASRPVSIEFGRTIRERVGTLLRFTTV